MFSLPLAKNKLLSLSLCVKWQWKEKPQRKKQESRLWERLRILSNEFVSISKYTWSLQETTISDTLTWETSGTGQLEMTGRTDLRGVPNGEDTWTLVVSLGRGKINISVILPLITFEILSEIGCPDAVCLLTEDISMHSCVHIYCYDNKCTSNAFPLLFFLQNLCQTIQSNFFSVYRQFESL